MSTGIIYPDFAPTLKGYTGQGAFRFWCQTVLPLVYDDSLSYYELLNKVVDYLNRVIKDVSATEENVQLLYDSYILLQGNVKHNFEELYQLYLLLKEYVDNYFNNLDVQDEINNKLDEMVCDGTFTRIISIYFPFVVPEAFGAKGDGVTDDHQALYDTIKFAFDNRIIIDNNNYNALTVVLSKKYYNGSPLEFSEDDCPANSVNILGCGGVITGNGFHFTETGGWKIHINNVYFADMDYAINMDYRNLEYGDYLIQNCHFRRIVNPLIINRRSCMFKIQNCYFKGVQKIGDFYDVDRLYFEKNWVEPSGIENEEYYSLLTQKTGNEGSAFIYDNLFVPASGTNCKELCWIEINEHARIYNNRFGGENTNFHPLRIGNGFAPKGGVNSKYPYLSFDHNDDVYGATPIILEKIAGNMSFTYNQGYNSGNKFLMWSDKITEEEQNTLIANQANMLNLVIRNNTGRTFLRDNNSDNIPATYKPSIPDNLAGVTNRPLRPISYNGGASTPWLKINRNVSGNTVDIVIAGQPFKGITANNLGYVFNRTNNFSILLSGAVSTLSGTYNQTSFYAIITFDYADLTITPKLEIITGEPDITMLINGSSALNTVTANEINELTLTINTTKYFRILKAHIITNINDLGIFL